MVDFSILVGLVMMVAGLWKKAGLNEQLIPILNVVVAILLTLIWSTDAAIIDRFQQGLIIGLSASGVYDIGKCFKTY